MSESTTSRRRRTRGPSLLRPGEAVRITQGTFQGYVGTIARADEERGRYVVNTHLLQKTVAVEFPASVVVQIDDLVSGWVKHLGSACAIEAVSTVSADLIRQLSTQPDDLYKLSPRKFEELVAELLDDMGYAVRLTPQTRDGGRDILAMLKTPVGELLTIVECKRFSPSRPVGVGVVRQFMWVVEQRDRANLGLIATTSRFSPDAWALQHQYHYRLSLRDKAGLQEWLARYGRWDKAEGGSLWLHHSPR